MVDDTRDAAPIRNASLIQNQELQRRVEEQEAMIEQLRTEAAQNKEAFLRAMGNHMPRDAAATTLARDLQRT